jgi:glycosyltransferase involved in cell wall biosynthesis
MDVASVQCHVRQFAEKQVERLCYVAMLASLWVGALVTLALAASLRLRPWRRRPDRELALFPYYPPAYPGYAARFGNYLAPLEKDGITHTVFAPVTAAQLFSLGEWPRRRQYLFYARTYWRRLSQVLAARHFRVVFVHRGLFPYYPDQRTPFLEILLRRLVKRTVIDFYDADYVGGPLIVSAATRHFDRITVVSEHLARHFGMTHSDVQVLPLCLELARYLEKQCYQTARPVRILWMGSAANAERLRLVQPALARLAREEDISLVAVCRRPVELAGVNVETVVWDDDGMRRLMPSCDLAIYPAEDSEVNRAKMALKVLEYMAVGLPSVVAPYGIPPCAVDGETALVAEGEESWFGALTALVRDESLRARIGRGARRAIEQHHSVDACYPQFKRLVCGMA